MEQDTKDRLSRQMAFLSEAEKLKLVARRNRTVDRARAENSAEHSWHVALMAMILAEHADAPGLDMLRVVGMLLVHDLVEIQAEDTWVFDDDAVAMQADRERAAADALFARLPTGQAESLRALWQEFADGSSAEARFAGAIDLLQPLANHLLSGRPEDDVQPPAAETVLALKRPIGEASRTLWEAAQALVKQSVAKGLYRGSAEDEAR